MSQTVIDRNDDLRRLRDEGYSLRVENAVLVIDDVPYVGPGGKIQEGKLISTLTLAGDKAVCRDHLVFFDGDRPHDREGNPLTRIINGEMHTRHNHNITSRMRFSSKPRSGYRDYHHKMTSYVEMVTGPARSLDPSCTPKKYKPTAVAEDDGPMAYVDTNASRAGISEINNRVAGQHIGIVGLGGTGSHILDMVSKTPVEEIRLVDGDEFFTHNAFRSPGAASIESLGEGMKKVDYFVREYSRMHRGLVAHPVYLDADNLNLLDGLDFVFVAIDRGDVKEVIFEYLLAQGIPFIDVGLDVQTNASGKLRGSIRTTAFTTPERQQELRKYINFSADDDGIYGTNIQIAELNTLNAAMAVLAWKQYAGIYNTTIDVGQTTFRIDTQSVIRVEDNET